MSAWGGEGTRPRPRVDRPSKVNQSSVPGGIFGYTPAAGRPNRPTDFLQQLEQAEQRDELEQRRVGDWVAYHAQDTAPYNNDALSYHRRVRLQQDRGSLCFGDDSPPHKAKSMYMTTSSAQQMHTQEMLERARAKHEERLVREQEATLMDIMTGEHGMSHEEARREIDLYRREQAQRAGVRAAPPQQRPQAFPQQRPHAHQQQRPQAHVQQPLSYAPQRPAFARYPAVQYAPMPAAPQQRYVAAAGR